MSASSRKLTKSEAELRDFALTFPEATEEFPWGERVVKVKGKIFLFLGQPPEGGFGIGVKLPVSSKSALALPFVKPAGYGLGKHGWVNATFESAGEMPLDLLKEWIDESYRAVAPKSVLAKLEAREEPAPPKKTKVTPKSDSRGTPRTTSSRRTRPS
jgi:predicted DNA-binding protein (MmcQ/YjbR family)